MCLLAENIASLIKRFMDNKKIKECQLSIVFHCDNKDYSILFFLLFFMVYHLSLELQQSQTVCLLMQTLCLNISPIGFGTLWLVKLGIQVSDMFSGSSFSWCQLRVLHFQIKEWPRLLC